MTDTVRCPYCDAEISAKAKKCRHCGEWVRGVCAKCGASIKGRWAAQSLCAECDKPARPLVVIQQAPVPYIPEKSSATAGFLGLFFGPVGLWYKGHWAARFAWLVMTAILAPTIIAIPFCWAGMVIHAISAETRP